MSAISAFSPSPMSTKGKGKPRKRSVNATLTHQLDSVLSDELKLIYQQLESNEELDDDELDALEKVLEQIERPRTDQPEPSQSLTREAMIAVYGGRYDRCESLWCDSDAVQRQARYGSLKDNKRTDLRTGRVEVVVIGPDGNPRIEERAVVQQPGGKFRVIGGGYLRLGRKKKGSQG